MVGSAPVFLEEVNDGDLSLNGCGVRAVVAQWLPRGLALIFTPRSSSSHTNPERPDSIWHWLQSKINIKPPAAGGAQRRPIALFPSPITRGEHEGPNPFEAS